MQASVVPWKRPRPRDWLKTAVQEGFTTLWAAGFGLLSYLRASPAEEVLFGGDGPVLVVAPHPDDEIVGCGGAILRHEAAKDQVSVAYVTDGRRSRAFGLAPQQMAETRRREAEAAAVHLHVDRLEWFGLPEGEWLPDELQSQLSGLLRRCKPTLVYAPSRVDFHPEHQAVAHGLAQALAACYPGDIGPRIRIFQIQVPLSAILVNRVVDISSVAPAHDCALDAHTSQRGSIVFCRRVKRYAARAHRLAGMAEVFWEVTTNDYVELHRENPDRWLDRFRGIRYLAVSDPAAYVVGRTARRRLSAACLFPASPMRGARGSFSAPEAPVKTGKV